LLLLREAEEIVPGKIASDGLTNFEPSVSTVDVQGECHQLNTQETLRVAPAVENGAGWRYGGLQSTVSTVLAGSRLRQIGYSFADQALAVGGGFLINVALARAQTKEEYGMFALSYSVFAFLLGLYHAAILEPYTIYGAGRYRERFSEYLRLIARSNAILCLLLSGGLLMVFLVFSRIAPQLTSRALAGLALTVGVLFTGHLLRRVFYLQHQPALAAKCSLVSFITVACLLWLTIRVHLLNSFSVFVILALAWIVAGASFGRKLRFGSPARRFLEIEPNYWQEHWNYAKWVFATAFVFQFTTQGYFWLVGGFLSLKEVGDLKAMYLIVSPVDQIFIALSYLVIPALAARYAAKRMGDLLSLWKRYALATVGVTGLFAVSVRVLGKPVMHVLYAGRYDGLAPYLYVLALLPLLMGIGNTMNNALIASEKPKLVFFAYVCSAGATFLGGIPLVLHFGMWGAVYGMLLSGILYTGALALAVVLRFQRPSAVLSSTESAHTLGQT
jgi:O-antigen/teichoic acid export membrane protein